MPGISIQNSNIDFRLPLRKVEIISWIERVISQEGFQLDDLSFVFTSDDNLLTINQTYLQHDDYTDIITFDYSEQPKTISGEILISVDRVKENAVKYETGFKQELARVMIHGVIHLLGYDDKTANQKKIMREKEDACISLLKI